MSIRFFSSSSIKTGEKRSKLTRPDAFNAQTFYSSGTFVVPPEITSISAVCIGGGASGKRTDTDADGGRAGDLRYATSIAVTPGESLTITVGTGGAAPSADNTYNSGSSTSIARGATILLRAAGGASQTGTSTGDSSTIGGTIGGGNGGSGGSADATNGGAGGGTGGYSGNGGAGVSTTGTWTSATNGPAAGSGGGAGGENSDAISQSGSGTGIWGTGADGAFATNPQGGSGGEVANINGTRFGSGGGGNDAATGSARPGGPGAVRIIWGKQTSSSAAYPSTDVTKEPVLVGSISGTGEVAASGTIDISSISVQTGDLILCVIGNGAVTPSTPSGFTSIQISTSTARMRTSYLVANGSVTTITLGASPITADMSYIVAVFRNVHAHSTAANNYFYSALFVDGTGPTTGTYEPYEIGVKNSVLLNVLIVANALVANTITPPSGWTLIKAVQKDNSTTTDGSLFLSYRIATNTNQIATANYNNTSGETYRVFGIRLLPGEYTTT